MVATKTRASFYMFFAFTYRIEEANFYLASVLVVEWLATFNQKRKIEQGACAKKLLTLSPPLW